MNHHSLHDTASRNRTGVSAEANWSTKWGPGGPKRLWTAQLGQGHSAVAVVGNRVYSMGNVGGQDTVYCLNAQTGRPLWKHSYPCAAGDYGGPRATPVVNGGNVYTLSREGHALCLNAATGKVVWSKHLGRELRAQAPRWGFAGSPLVTGKMVIYNVGAAGTGVDRATGKTVWNSGGGVSGYASPVPYAHKALSGVAIFGANSIVAVDPANGRRLWQHPWQTNYDVNSADPVFFGDHVMVSSNYNKGCAVIWFGGKKPVVVWQNRNMRNHFNSSVFVGGAVYGNDENTLKCIDFNTGAERWRQRGMGKGGLIAAGGKLIALTERGELLVVQATPAAYKEIARAKVMGGTCWTHPVLAGGRIYCRNHEGELVCLDVRAAA